MMSNVVHFNGDLRPPVFKVRAQIEFWRSDDPGRVPTMILCEEVVTTTPNRQDMEAIARSKALGGLSQLGVDTNKLDYQLWSVEFFAARSRAYAGTLLDVEPEWVSASDDLKTKEQAIRDLTYLRYDLAEQREVYGA